ncbi:E3 ubiquitin ligase BIG BROTHER [Forsythia ovata]|uniref:E3 ubiquitin ligase BIG BROTHER n=1 Tax=Forsythia ovata TaxID=205694 RepID=A0ABD1WKY0_9LAMI
MSRFSGHEDESRWEDIEQLTLDEALARSLQLEDDFDDSDVSGYRAGNKLPRVVSRSRRHDNIDPDNMTYEELQTLDEAFGNECEGLSEYLISRLPTFKYKAGSSARKKEGKE